jgi:sucrose phosphorylase
MTFEQLTIKLRNHLAVIYPQANPALLIEQLLAAMQYSNETDSIQPETNTGWNKSTLWDESTSVLITYGDTILSEGEKPLHVLDRFLSENLRESISHLHILPFFPYSSDDGFSVIDYREVRQSLGDWQDITALSKHFTLMGDVVINHISSESEWFQNYRKGLSPGQHYFIEADPGEDLSLVTRPRTSPLLSEVETINGQRHVWCTFSADQVDLNFANPEVLIEFVAIMQFYLENGIRWFRLDAVAFLWKRLGTPCIHLQETHEIIKLLRTLLEYAYTDAVIVSETNVPNRENLTYFGNANEAHVIYNFSLPPLLLHTLTTGDCRHIKTWLMSMPPAQNGTSYLNFIASHDGIGLRPTEGLLSDDEITGLINSMEQFGGKITRRRHQDSDSGEITEKAYELNISLFDALQGTQQEGPDRWQIDRYLCAHNIMMALEGIPALYIHSLVGTSNDYARVNKTGHMRSINRHQWHLPELEEQLATPHSHHTMILEALKKHLAIRQTQAAFHPNATQFTLHLGTAIFGFWRQSIQRDQSIFCINNISAQIQKVLLCDINLIATDDWVDLLSGNTITEADQAIFLQPYQTLWLSNRAAQ